MRLRFLSHTTKSLINRSEKRKRRSGKFLAATPWKPTVCTVFAGALLYPRYGWFDRMMIRLIMKMTKGETDTTKEVEYTDWQQVEAFAAEFVQI